MLWYKKEDNLLLRAASEVKRSIPVLVSGNDGKMYMVLAAELLDHVRLKFLKKLNFVNQYLVLSHERAMFLGLHKVGLGHHEIDVFHQMVYLQNNL